MKGFRIAFLTTSVIFVSLFAGLLAAGLATDESLFQSLGNLAEVVHLVETEYVDELDTDVLAQALDAGILLSIDPWAAVVADEELAAAERLFTEPPAYGLGLSLRLGSAAVRYVFPGSPADDAGLAVWEVIERIDGVYTRGRPLWQIALDLADREARGEVVRLTVMDRQVDERREVELAPREWTPKHASMTEVGDAVVLTVHSLTAGAADAIAELIDGRPPDIIDLRGLVWGREEQAIRVADLFISEGVIAAWKGRKAGSRVVEAAGAAEHRVPLVLIDSETEGVGEILAAAFKRSGSELLGGESMGHAPHMAMVRSNGLNLWIPVGRWLGPDDEPLHRDGLAPDEEIESAGEDDEGDPVLDRAIAKLAPALDEAA